MKILGLLVTALCVFAAWRHFYSEPPATLAVGLDPSGSIKRNCAGVRQVAELASTAPGMRSGSAVTLLLMGSGPGDEEPRRVFNATLPAAPTAYEVGGKQETRAHLFDEIERACEGATETPHSPVYELVRRAVAVARSAAGSKARGYVLIKSDGMDDVRPEMRRALALAAMKRQAETPPALARSIDNAGVEVRFCGGAEVARRNPRSAHVPPETVAVIWRGLFTNPDQVQFLDYCGAGPERAAQK